MLLRHCLLSGDLRFAQNRPQRPEFAIAHDPAKVLLCSREWSTLSSSYLVRRTLFWGLC